MTGFRPDNPLIVQGDHTLLLEVDSPRYAEARDRLAPFAELVKSPEHVHTYRITPLSIWNACAAGVSAEEIVAALADLAKYPVPEQVTKGVRDHASRYGRLRLLAACAAEPPRLRSNDLTLFARSRDAMAALLPRLPAAARGGRS